MQSPIKTKAQTQEPLRGKIITFYSYKGGTGRSMAVANVGWILASNGFRVLAIDWDLEAPGLHRYFHPFLKDKELTASPGLIDFFVDVSAAARCAQGDQSGSSEPPWWTSWTSLFRYTYSLDWEFPGKGTLDFVPAGKQGASYGPQAMTFNWHEFYDKVGGGVFLEALKRDLRSRYDYVLIDSRTGISDTAGICTVQLPDDLVVCFTLNQQSIKGAAAVAESAEGQRRKPTGEPGLRVWPVPTRIELSEKDRLDSARAHARITFQKFLGHLPRAEKASYWGNVEVQYQPFFAYEEVLATFADSPRHTLSMLNQMVSLTRVITRQPRLAFPEMNERARLTQLSNFIHKPEPPLNEPYQPAKQVYLSYRQDNAKVAQAIVDELSQHQVTVWWDRGSLLFGSNIEDSISKGLESSDAVIALVSRSFGEGQMREIEFALKTGKRIIPVLSPGTQLVSVPAVLRILNAAFLRDETLVNDIKALTVGVIKVLQTTPSQGTLRTLDPDDPQKGLWGGQAEGNGRALRAQVRTISSNWFEISLQVIRVDGPPLEGRVDFHLHPTFPNQIETVQVKDGKASLELGAWGAFTVGAVADNGETKLELDLSENISFPQVFRER